MNNYSDYWKERWEPSKRVADLIGLMAGSGGPVGAGFLDDLLTDFGYTPYARERDEFRELRGFGYVEKRKDGLWWFTEEGARWAAEKWGYTWLLEKSDA